MSLNLEGPSPGSDVVFVLGARPVTNGFDLNFAGSISVAMFAPNEAPPMFSTCILECLESTTVNTSGTPLTTTPFNVSSRQLQIVGPATPEQVEQVLQSMVYLNRAPTVNVESIQLEVISSYSIVFAFDACCLL